MRRLYFVLLLCSFLSYVCLSAQNREMINHFTVTSNVPQPVMIVTNLGAYCFSYDYVILGKITKLEAYDINGNHIVNIQTKKSNSSNEVWYLLSIVAKGSSPYIYEGGDASIEHYSTYSVSQERRRLSYGGFPNLQLRIGTGVMGESVNLKTVLGSDSVGFGLFGGVQKDLLFFKNSNSGYIDGWNAGLGLCGGGLHNELSFDLIVGNHYRIPKYFLFSFQWSHFFGSGRIGFFLEGGIGAYSQSKFLGNFLPCVQGGVACRLFYKHIKKEKPSNKGQVK